MNRLAFLSTTEAWDLNKVIVTTRIDLVDDMASAPDLFCNGECFHKGFHGE
jgi:hypothetical protein